MPSNYAQKGNPMENTALVPWDSARHNLNPSGCDGLLDSDLITRLTTKTAVTLTTNDGTKAQRDDTKPLSLHNADHRPGQRK